jgi:TonB family protein
MARSTIFIVVAVAALASAQAHADPKPNWPKGPDWLRKPTGQDMANYYPEKAQRDAVSGRGIIDCDVTAKGLLDHCRVVDDFPAGYAFGEAALKLGRIFRLDPKTVDVADPARNRVIIPIIFNALGKPPPPSGFLAGSNALALTLGVPPTTKNAVPCATTEKPDQLCTLHALEWEESPWLAQTLPALDGVDMTSGVSLLQCQVSPERRLTHCVATGNPTPAGQKAMLAVADMMVAPNKALDGAPVGDGPVVIPFEWSKITPLARSLKRP